jgi:Leucine-rich repeat (LRR) protein
MQEIMPEDGSIDGFENLQVLSMNDCSLSGTVPDWLSKLTNLGILCLNNNQLTGQIPDWIRSLNFLFYLDISNNSLTGEIPSALMDMSMLKSDKTTPKVFELPIYSGPALQYRIITSYPRVLNLSHNYFTGVIPQEIVLLKMLDVLDFSFNKLSGKIPRSTCNLTNL